MSRFAFDRKGEAAKRNPTQTVCTGVNGRCSARLHQVPAGNPVRSATARARPCPRRRSFEAFGGATPAPPFFCVWGCRAQARPTVRCCRRAGFSPPMLRNERAPPDPVWAFRTASTVALYGAKSSSISLVPNVATRPPEGRVGRGPGWSPRAEFTFTHCVASVGWGFTPPKDK